jgi:hypothetical protein
VPEADKANSLKLFDDFFLELSDQRFLFFFPKISNNERKRTLVKILRRLHGEQGVQGENMATH